MSKLKDHKDKIKGWPGKKEIENRDCSVCNGRGFYQRRVFHGKVRTVECDHCRKSNWMKDMDKGFNQAHEIFSNLEMPVCKECKRILEGTNEN